MRVMLTVASVAPSAGGPSRSVPALRDALAKQGVAAFLVAYKRSRSALDEVVDGALDAAAVATHPAEPEPPGPNRFLARSFERAIRSCVERENVQMLHDSGIWLPTNHAVANFSRASSLPLVISPRGML